MNRNVGTNNRGISPAGKKAVTEYSRCPNCGRKGVYRIKGQYCRCRYCGLYRMMMPEGDLKGEKIYLAIVAKHGKQT